MVIAPGPTHMVETAALTPTAPFLRPVSVVAVGGGETASEMVPTIKEFQFAPVGGVNRIALHLHFDQPGDFSNCQ